jgi:hypothetical protein
VVIESRHVPGHPLALPVLSRLYLNKTSAQKWNRGYRKKSELMLELLHILERHTSGSNARNMPSRNVTSIESVPQFLRGR